MNPTITIITLLVQFVPSSSQINSIQLYYVITEHLLPYPVQSTTCRLKHPSMNQLPNSNMNETYAMKLTATSAFLSKSALITCITASESSYNH